MVATGLAWPAGVFPALTRLAHLRGVGKEKVLAAHRAGLKTIVLPKDNEKDLADIPKAVLDVLNVYMVQTMDDVLKIALADALPGPIAAPVTEGVDVEAPDDTITH